WDNSIDGGRGILQISDATTGADLRKIHTPTHVNSLAFSPDGGRVGLACGNVVTRDTGTVTVWDVNSGALLLTLCHPAGACFGVAFSPDGNLLAAGGGPFRDDESEVTVWDASSGKVVHTLHGHTGALVGVAFSPDGDRLASSGRDKKIKIWDMRSGLEAL